MRGIAGSLVTGLIIIAVIFVLVRPGSNGTKFVTAVGNGLKGLFGTVTGGGTWAKA